MPIVRWRPHWAEPFEGGLENFFEDFPRLPEISNFIPAIDVYQKDDRVIVEAPLAGVNPEDVEISIEKDVLTIRGETEKKSEVDEKNYYRKEVRSGSFCRSIALPAAVKADEASATSKDGVLKIEIPKAGEEKKKTIRIEVQK